jgi:hypothetical protein
VNHVNVTHAIVTHVNAMISLTMWTFADNVNHDLVRPEYQDYRCTTKKCSCTVSEMCKGKWRRYQKDLLNHIDLKFKDTY